MKIKLIGGEESRASRARIVRSTSIIGGATLVSMVMALVRSKVIALTLGPAGVGLIGILTNLMATCANLASLGIGMSGIRHVAEAAGVGDEAAVARASRAMLVGMMALAVSGAAIVYLTRDLLAKLVLSDPTKASVVGWLAVGVALLVSAGSQGAILNGLGRTRELALSTILSAVLSTIVGITLVLTLGNDAILPIVLIAPAVSFLVGHVFVARLSLPAADASIRESLRDCARLAKLGFSFLLSLMILGVAYLAVRARVQATLGLVALGHFEAAWTISMAYLGAVMAAMGTDFYPRLTALIDKPADASTLVNEQTRVALWLCAPICIGVIGFAPIATTLLFSSAFAESARLLQLLVLGDILKVLGWPLQYVILAAGDGRRFIALHVVSVLLLVGTPFLFLADLGLKSVGLGYIGFYLAYLPLVYFWARKRIGFRWDRDILIGGAILLVCALATFAAASWSDEAGMIVGGVLMTGIGISSLRHLSHLAPRESLVGRMAASLGRFTPVRSHDD